MSTFDNAPPPADWQPEARENPFAASTQCDCESMGGRFGAHRAECPWQIAFEAQLAQLTIPPNVVLGTE